MRKMNLLGQWKGIFLALTIAVVLYVFSGVSTAQSGPTLEGCPIFPPDNIWNTPVADLPLNPNSSAFINTIGPTRGLHPDFGSGTWNGGPIGIPYNVVDGSQTEVNISFEYTEESDPGPYPKRTGSDKRFRFRGGRRVLLDGGSRLRPRHSRRRCGRKLK